MQFDLAGKADLVTGSSRGIGLAIADAWHGEDCKVALIAEIRKSLASVAVRVPNANAVAGSGSQPKSRELSLKSLSLLASLILWCEMLAAGNLFRPLRKPQKNGGVCLD
jgi:NAD(P)-dependent dehydrogenase (short-subunit alcohol dehydrogenase family)